ncbi:MAG: Gfo/Idh/MocA family oxidoreductase [Planctomycetaceae bacterium]|jgi:predicted dehydrogenase|nr:Gfo/Idh/MocA family oxidoreductase [Planctomycetaceae bacterium]
MEIFMTAKRSWRKLSRRNFIQTAAAAAAAPFVIPASAIGADGETAPSERITVGHIGVGGRGGGIFRHVQPHKAAQSVAAADCFKSRREGFAAVCKGKAYADFREILARDDVDAVIIATPDHWHVPAALAAAKAKKHVYLEKPLGLTIEQNLMLQKAFAGTGLVFQYGTQQRSMEKCRHACALVRSGVLGKITAIEVDAPNGGKGGSAAEAPVPPDLGEDGYEMWVGPAPKKPFTPDRCKPPGTYWIYDYSVGYLGGWGAHPLDLMVWGSDADLSGIITVEGTGDVPAEGLYDTVYNWNMKIKLGEVDFTFRTGSDRTRFIGERGWIETGRHWEKAGDPELLKVPVDAYEVLRLPKRDAAAVQNLAGDSHSGDFIAAIKTGTAAVSTLKDAVRSDNITQLCDIAVRTKSAVKWDPVRFQLVDATPEQTKMLSRPMREPWTL